MELRRRLAKATKRLADDLYNLEEVRRLLARADERLLKEPHESRKWNRVLDALEKSLDQAKARCVYAEITLRQAELACEEFESALGRPESGQTPIAAFPPLPTGDSPDAPPDDDGTDDDGTDDDGTERWAGALGSLNGLTLEEASQLQSRFDAGELQDERLEADLVLANQVRQDAPADGQISEPRRQLVLRAAIDKVSKRAFDDMTVDEIRLLMACHSLLTSRLEPTMRDQRLRRILDGAIKILQRKKESMEGG